MADITITLNDLINGGHKVHAGWLAKKGAMFWSTYKAFPRRLTAHNSGIQQTMRRKRRSTEPSSHVHTNRQYEH